MGFIERVFLGRRTQDFSRPTPRNGPPAGSYPQRPPAPTRSDLSTLLGRNVAEEPVRTILREYDIDPDPPTRSLQSRRLGVEITTDDYGTVTTVLLHYNGDDHFAAFTGPIPGPGGETATRSGLWAALGRPQHTTEAYTHRYLGEYGPADRWDLPAFHLRAQYTVEGEDLLRLTLRH